MEQHRGVNQGWNQIKRIRCLPAYEKWNGYVYIYIYIDIHTYIYIYIYIYIHTFFEVDFVVVLSLVSEEKSNSKHFTEWISGVMA